MMDSYIDDIITHNINLVYHVLKKTGFYNQIDEYRDIAIIGLVKGAKSFDFSKNYKMSTYLAKCIQNEIYLYYRKQRAKKRGNGLSDISLYHSISIDDGENIEIQDIIKSSEDILDIVTKRIMIEKILDEINQLCEEQKSVINLYYGLNGYNHHTQNEIAHLINKSQPQVCRIIKHFISQMKNKYNGGN